MVSIIFYIFHLSYWFNFFLFRFSKVIGVQGKGVGAAAPLVTFFIHKNSLQNAGNGIKETLFFKIFWGSMLQTLPSRGEVDSCLPSPKVLSQCAYGRRSAYITLDRTGHLIQLTSAVVLNTYLGTICIMHKPNMKKFTSNELHIRISAVRSEIDIL